MVMVIHTLHIVKDVVKHHFIHLCHHLSIHLVIHPSHHGLFTPTGRRKSGIETQYGGE
jgi:hypothetical protein